MPIYEIPDIISGNASEGLDNLIVGIVQQESTFLPMILLFVFGVVFLGGMVSQRRRSGYSDTPLWATLGCLSCLLVALPFSMASSMIDLPTLVIVVTFTLLSGIWFFLSKGRGEI